MIPLGINLLRLSWLSICLNEIILTVLLLSRQWITTEKNNLLCTNQSETFPRHKSMVCFSLLIHCCVLVALLVDVFCRNVNVKSDTCALVAMESESNRSNECKVSSWHLNALRVQWMRFVFCLNRNRCVGVLLHFSRENYKLFKIDWMQIEYTLSYYRVSGENIRKSSLFLSFFCKVIGNDSSYIKSMYIFSAVIASHLLMEFWSRPITAQPVKQLLFSNAFTLFHSLSLCFSVSLRFLAHATSEHIFFFFTQTHTA